MMAAIAEDGAAAVGEGAVVVDGAVGVDGAAAVGDGAAEVNRAAVEATETGGASHQRRLTDPAMATATAATTTTAAVQGALQQGRHEEQPLQRTPAEPDAELGIHALPATPPRGPAADMAGTVTMVQITIEPATPTPTRTHATLVDVASPAAVRPGESARIILTARRPASAGPAGAATTRSTSDLHIQAAFKVAATRSAGKAAVLDRERRSLNAEAAATAGGTPLDDAPSTPQAVRTSSSPSSGARTPSWGQAEALATDRLTVAQALENADGPDLLDPTWLSLLKTAARLGRGLLEDRNARTLMVEHWLEAADAKHRYGSLLKHYHQAWRESSTREKFFQWLDEGEGRSLDLPDAPRERLERSLVHYCTDAERRQYVVVVVDGLLVFQQSQEPVHTAGPGEPVTGDRNGDKYIFVFDTHGTLHIGRKVKGSFHHSSFLAGGTVRAAGNLVVDHGRLLRISPHSGHYMPSVQDMEWVLQLLARRGVDLAHVVVDPLKKDAA